MKMYYCETDPQNFGDELNVWMWPKLLPDAFDLESEGIFLGIGSILFDHFPAREPKVVFGAGYGGYTPPPVIDETWKIYFVRGKLTAARLGIDPKLAVGDAAILLRSCLDAAPPKRFRVSFMPHWESTLWGSWRKVCETADIHYLDPSESVPQVLDEIRASDLVITEAMHGAIVSDSLRVPWIPIQPNRVEHRMKWQDWLSVLDVPLNPSQLSSSNLLELIVGKIDSKKWANRLHRRGLFRNLGEDYFVERAARALREISRDAPSLSSEAAIVQAHERMLAKLSEFKRDLAEQPSRVLAR